MLNINELKAKAALTGMSIVDTEGDLYQIYTDSGYAIGHPQDLASLQNADYWGVLDDFEEVGDEQDAIEFLCTNGSNSGFKVMAVNADAALQIAAKRFDGESDYVLPINVVGEDGLTGACISESVADLAYTDDEMGLSDDY